MSALTGLHCNLMLFVYLNRFIVIRSKIIQVLHIYSIVTLLFDIKPIEILETNLYKSMHSYQINSSLNKSQTRVYQHHQQNLPMLEDRQILVWLYIFRREGIFLIHHPKNYVVRYTFCCSLQVHIFYIYSNEKKFN